MAGFNLIAFDFTATAANVSTWIGGPGDSDGILSFRLSGPAARSTNICVSSPVRR
jgi:hypothetical protein